jgi:hypothetical protein
MTARDLEVVPVAGADREAQFRALVVTGAAGECWEWLGAKSNHGYALLSIHRASHLALIYSGRPKTASFALHSCDNPGCVNPDHLRWGTPKENAADMVQRKRHQANRKQSCIRGHPLSGENLIARPGGQRGCRTCQRKFHAEYKARKKEARNAAR